MKEREKERSNLEKAGVRTMSDHTVTSTGIGLHSV